MYLNNNFSPIFGSKNLNYYQAILKETHSVVIEVTDRSNKDIAFSKFLIRKVLTPQEWGIGLSTPRYLTQYQNQPKSFTYLDYIFAWERGLLYENSLKRIFCKIEKKFSIQIMEPYLFRQNYLRWWNKFDFFDKEAVYTKRGVIALTPPTAPKQPTKQSTPQLSLKDMLAGLSQEEAMKLFAETFGDSQDPYEEENDDSLIELTQHLEKS
ncbi:hypothetical protein CDL12_10209 [Handroanthus impetiginosus]|uniref:Uncharacterized protein n=1 Tax=Handroanthus impetiginosus TaxID=429701 RepID=A0A2G9HHV9_9LAMI|nr:hypothetical protein CDL12_10209 [Handroanthus impetiginosus]